MELNSKYYYIFRNYAAKVVFFIDIAKFICRKLSYFREIPHSHRTITRLLPAITAQFVADIVPSEKKERKTSADRICPHLRISTINFQLLIDHNSRPKTL